MSTGYTKLFSSIVTSTIWVESDRTRIVWITMLAMADKNGEVQASIPGLARLAGVPIPDCEEAIAKFMAPDPYSRTPDDEGRRIEKIDGGWALLNHKKYREMASKDDQREAEARRKARYRDKVKRNEVSQDVPDKSRDVPEKQHIAEAEAEAEAKADTDRNTPLPPKGGQETGELPLTPPPLPPPPPPPKPPKAKSAIQLRAERIMGRRESTPMTSGETRAFSKNRAAIEATPEADWQLLESFYAAPQTQTYARKDLATLLNNWNGEIDRAHKWKGNVATSSYREPKLRIE